MRQGRTISRAALGLILLGSWTALGRADDAHAPLPDSRLGTRTAPILLLSRPDVRADLKLDARQEAAAEVAITDLYVSAAALRGKTGTQVLAGRKAIDDGQRAWMEANLTPEQSSRLAQVDLQWEGMSALVSRPVVAGAVGISAEQKAGIVQAIAARDATRASRTYSLADERAFSVRVLGMLTPPQKEIWESMLGREFVPKVATGGIKAPSAASATVR